MKITFCCTYSTNSWMLWTQVLSVLSQISRFFFENDTIDWYAFLVLLPNKPFLYYFIKFLKISVCCLYLIPLFCSDPNNLFMLLFYVGKQYFASASLLGIPFSKSLISNPTSLFSNKTLFYRCHDFFCKTWF